VRLSRPAGRSFYITSTWKSRRLILGAVLGAFRGPRQLLCGDVRRAVAEDSRTPARTGIWRPPITWTRVRVRAAVAAQTLEQGRYLGGRPPGPGARAPHHPWRPLQDGPLGRDSGDAAAARDQLAALLPITERVMGPEHYRTLAIRADLARWATEAGDAPPDVS